MAKRKIKVGGSDVEQKLTDTLNKNLKKLKEDCPHVPEQSTDTMEELCNANYGTEIAVKDVSLKDGYVSTEELEETLNKKFNEMTDNQNPEKKLGYASAYTNTKTDQPIEPEQYDEYFFEHAEDSYLSTEENKQFEERIAPYVKELTDKVEKVFTKLSEKQDNGESVTLRDNSDLGPIKIEQKVLDCINTIKNLTNKSIDYNQFNKDNYNNCQIGLDLGHKEGDKTVEYFLTDGNNYEMVNHPTHYNQYDKEVIDMIESIWGTYLAQKWCEITAFKYRMRMGTKPGNSIEQDLKKEKWYLDKSAELKAKSDILLG